MVLTGDPRQPARERILDTAFRLFYAHGPRKDDLVLAYLDTVDQTWLDQLRAAAKAAGDQPRDQLVGLFDGLRSACRSESYHGCAFLNTAAEFDAGTAVHTRTVEHKNAVRAWLADLACRAGAADPDQLARQLSLLLDGGLSAGVLDADPAVAEAAKAAAAILVEAACPPR